MNEITKEVIIVTSIAATLAVMLLIGTIAWITWAQNKAEKKAMGHDEWKGFVMSREADMKLSKDVFEA
jgi:hypothetical protein